MANENATDAAVALADAHGVDLSTVPATGAAGAITVDDVKAGIPAPAPEPVAEGDIPTWPQGPDYDPSGDPGPQRVEDDPNFGK